MFFEEKIKFISGEENIVGLFTRPDNGIFKKLPCVILSHGYINSKDEFGGFKELTDILVETQKCVFRFDFRGCGESGGKPGRMFCSTDWPEDLMNAVSYVLTRPDVDPLRIALIGQSIGGSTVSYISAYDDRVKTVISMAAVADGKKWLEQLWMNRRGLSEWKKFLDFISADRKNRILSGKSEIMPVSEMLARDDNEKEQMEEWHKKFPYYQLDAPVESIESVMNFRPIDVIHRCMHPIFFIHGMEDSLVPHVHSDLLYERVSTPKKKEIIAGAGHDLLIGPLKNKVQKLILDWCNEWL